MVLCLNLNLNHWNYYFLAILAIKSKLCWSVFAMKTVQQLLAVYVVHSVIM